jgi:hypothetical protein
MPAIIPEKRGAPEARATPKHNGRATRKTTTPAGKSTFKFLKGLKFSFSFISLILTVHC